MTTKKQSVKTRLITEANIGGFTKYNNQDKKEAWIVQFNDEQHHTKKKKGVPFPRSIGSMKEFLDKCHDLFKNYEFMQLDKNQMEQKD